MARRGWFSGDTHSHRLLSETPNLILAEDLNLAFPLSHWVTGGRESAVAANRIKRPALPLNGISSKGIPTNPVQPIPIRVDDDHWIYPLNTEYEIFGIGGKRHELGAVVIIGHTSLFDTGAPSRRTSPCGRCLAGSGKTLVGLVADDRSGDGHRSVRAFQ